MGMGTDRHSLAFVKWVEGLKTMKPRSLLRRSMRGRWVPGISVSWHGGDCSSFFFLLFLACEWEKRRGGEAIVTPPPCRVPGSPLQYCTQYSDHLASQGSLWSLQWCQSEKRAKPSRLARRWLSARSKCWSAVSSFAINLLWTVWWAGGLHFVLVFVYKTLSHYI